MSDVQCVENATPEPRSHWLNPDETSYSIAGKAMISVTKLDGREMIVNADQIETIEATPDTVISLVSGRKHIVKESKEDVIKRVLRYKGQIQRLITAVGKEK